MYYDEKSKYKIERPGQELNMASKAVTKKTGLIILFSILIFGYLIGINLFFGNYMNIFVEDKAWIPQMIMLLLLPYLLSTVNQFAKDKLFGVINAAFGVSIALFVGFFAFEIVAMAASNEIQIDANYIESALMLPSYGLMSFIIFMFFSRLAVKFKASFHLIVGIATIFAVMAFIKVVDVSAMNGILPGM